MELPIKVIIRFAEKKKIIDSCEVERITEDLFSIPLSQLDEMSVSFCYAKNYYLNSDCDYEDLTLLDAMRIPYALRGCDDAERRALFQNILIGLRETKSIPQIEKFYSLPLELYLKTYPDSDYDTLKEISEKYLYLQINDDISIGEFFKNIRYALAMPWHVKLDFNYYRESIEKCIDIVDIFFSGPFNRMQ